MAASSASSTPAKASRSSRWFCRATRTGRMRRGSSGSRAISSATMKSNSSRRVARSGPATARTSWRSQWTSVWMSRASRDVRASVCRANASWVASSALGARWPVRPVPASSVLRRDVAPWARRDRWGGRLPTASMCQSAGRLNQQREPSTMSITMIGLDTAKSIFQVHGVDAAGKPQLKRKLRREEVIPFFERQERCTVVLEACGAGHHWARVLTQLGHEAKLLAPEAARPFVKKGKKNDAADAAALCTAGSRPEVTFVPVKSPEQQGVLALHSVRTLLVKQQTMLANAMRGLAAEFGLVVAKGIHKLEELEAQVQAETSMPAPAKQAFAELHGHSQAAAKRIAGLEAQIVAHARRDGTARRLAPIPRLGR